MKIIYTDHGNIEFISENAQDDTVMKYLENNAKIYTSRGSGKLFERILGKEKQKVLMFSQY